MSPTSYTEYESFVMRAMRISGAPDDYYDVGGIETIDFIEAKRLSFRLGNVVKYIARADYKGDARGDLHKALWYLQREIEKRGFDE